MKILMTGGTGFIGSRFIQRYSDYQYTVLTRSTKRAEKILPNNVKLIDSLGRLTHLDDFDAVINLAGEPIVGRRWSSGQKEKICASRWETTQQLVDLIGASQSPPKVFLSGSAVGIYGDRNDQPLPEVVDIKVTDFPSMLCEEWEKIALKADSKTRVVLSRTGIVLDDKQGAMEKMVPPFKFNLGGHFGSGEQYMPWIHIADMLSALNYLLQNQQCVHAFNMVAPEPVKNKEFTKELAAALNRIAILPVPKLALKIMLGEAAKLLLDSQRAIPDKLEQAGFEFEYKNIKPALDELFN